MTDQTSPDQAAPDGPAAPREPVSGAPPEPAGSGARHDPGLGAPPEPRLGGQPIRRSPETATPPARRVQYRGDDLEAARGPGLGCFWAQVIVLGVLVVLTPVTVSLGWPFEVSAFLLFATIGLLLLTGQTIIFLLRLVAAERRGRRRPLSSGTRTVGELEDAAPAPAPHDPAPASAPDDAAPVPEPPGDGPAPATAPPLAAAGEPDAPDDVRQ